MSAAGEEDRGAREGPGGDLALLAGVLALAETLDPGAAAEVAAEALAGLARREAEIAGPAPAVTLLRELTRRAGRGRRRETGADRPPPLPDLPGEDARGAPLPLSSLLDGLAPEAAARLLLGTAARLPPVAESLLLLRHVEGVSGPRMSSLTGTPAREVPAALDSAYRLLVRELAVARGRPPRDPGAGRRDDLRPLVHALAAGEVPPRDRERAERILAADGPEGEEARALLEDLRCLEAGLGRFRGSVRPAPLPGGEPARGRPSAGARTLPSRAIRRRLALAGAGLGILLLAGLGLQRLGGRGSARPPAPGGSGDRTRGAPAALPHPAPPERPAPTPRETAAAAKPAAAPAPASWRPVGVRPGLAMLLPRLRKVPSQEVLEKAWKAAGRDPGDRERLRRAFLRTGEEKARVALLLVLSVFRAETAVRAELADLLRADPSPRVRVAAAAALARGTGEGAERATVDPGFSVPVAPLPDAETRRLLLDALEREPDPRARTSLALILAPSVSRDPDLLPRLLQSSGDHGPAVREALLRRLRLRGPEDVPRILPFVRNPALSPAVRRRLLEQIAAADPRGAASLFARLSRESAALHSAVLTALAGHPVPGSLRLAEEALSGASRGPIREAAVQAVAAHRTPRALAILERAAREDASEAVRDLARRMADRLARELDR